MSNLTTSMILSRTRISPDQLAKQQLANMEKAKASSNKWYEFQSLHPILGEVITSIIITASVTAAMKFLKLE